MEAGQDIQGFDVDWRGWHAAGCPAPGLEFHKEMMPYARSTAAEARNRGSAGTEFREAAVLMGIEPGGHLMLIERTPEKGPHGGQMALPGGAREAGESMEECALREWREELGLPAAWSPLMEGGPLSEVHVVPSGFVVRPYVFPVRMPERLRPDVIEVAALHRIRIADLVGHEFRTEESVRIHMPGMKEFRWRVPGFSLPEVPFIWGATALMLSELAEWYRRWARDPMGQD